jgi:TrkA family protein
VARVLIVGGGCRGRTLAATLAGDGHAVRITNRTEQGRAAIEAAGAECWIGDPDRLVTLREALAQVTIACWMLAGASGDEDSLIALHDTRLQYWLTQVIDTTVRGLVYEAAGSIADAALQRGRTLVRDTCTLNVIPFALLESDPADAPAWQREARGAIDGLLSSSA